MPLARVLPAEPEFQSAFVAVAYFLGQRGEALLQPFQDPAPKTRDLCARLSSEARPARAAALAKELALIVARLEQRRLR